MRGYTQLVHEQRYQIYALMKAGLNQTEIADNVGVHKSTISRELRRNCGLRGYRPKQTHSIAMESQNNRVTTRISDSTWFSVESLLREYWSPEQISCWLILFKRTSISHEWIYQHIYQDKYYGDDLHHHLRCQKKRRKRYGSYDRRGQIINRISIDESLNYSLCLCARRHYKKETQYQGQSLFNSTDFVPDYFRDNDTKSTTYRM